MFGLSDLKQTRFYQEAVEEGMQKGKLETIPIFKSLGLNAEQIAQFLNLNVEEVREIMQKQNSKTKDQEQ